MQYVDVARAPDSTPTALDLGEGFLPLRVKSVVSETPDAVSLSFEVPAQQAAYFGYTAGQFVTVRAHLDGERISRCYSMSSSPDTDQDLRITVKRVAGGRLSPWLVDGVREGDVVAVAPPGGRFTLRETGRPVVAYAAGSGITPVLSILKSHLATTDRPARLLYANRDESSIILRGELDALVRQYDGRLQVGHHLDSQQGALEPSRVAEFLADAGVADHFVCGPEGFMGLVERVLTEADVPSDCVNLERFALAESGHGSHPKHLAPETVDVSVTLGSQTRTVRHRREHNLLMTARATGFRPPSSCELGQCGTCIARLVTGKVHMVSSTLLDEDEVADGYVLMCQSWPTTEVIEVVYE